MPLKIYRRKGSDVWHYRGTLAGRRQRGTTGTSHKETAARIASEVENKFWKRGLDGKEKALTWPKASALYLAAGKPSRFLAPLVKYWGDAKIADINSGSIRQSAIDLYPNAKNSTRNRQVIVPTLAVINHCAELGHCSPLRMKRFKVDTKIKKPVTLEWINAFRAAAERPDIGALALFMFATGARVSEALAVRWDDIVLKEQWVLIRQTKLGNERRAHIPAQLLVALANLPRDRDPFAIAYTTARDSWSRTVAAAGIEPLTFHSCRHGFATTLHDKGVGVKTIANAGGWKSAQHLFNTYLHADQDATITDRIFDTETDTTYDDNKQDQLLKPGK
ncbi:site-specific integrase [Bradyrhizobium sp. 17]|uniref:tyrosine-type recombinase/integrase n=1 Tax=Bradyrhizobium sp. 17 TaxID=2782649 RepID=UPI001FF987CC|nr:site-specific integrase [Bradyrhizobium sp. 17]MCK1520187.1 site-specific integrase [Bradyrhizobium sp. 17]